MSDIVNGRCEGCGAPEVTRKCTQCGGPFQAASCWLSTTCDACKAANTAAWIAQAKDAESFEPF